MLRMRSSAIPLSVWITLGIILGYLLAWYDVPLFYDEVAFRIYRGRAFVDGFMLSNLFPQCTAFRPTPTLLLPAHAVYSWIDGWPSWLGLRTLPLLALGVLLASVSAAIMRLSSLRDGRWNVMLLCGAFVGVSGLGMALSRPEFVMLLHGACILATWQLSRRSTPGALPVLLMTVIHLFVASLSLLIHLQGVLLMPLSFITCMQLLRQRSWAAVLVSILMTIMTLSALSSFTLHCPKEPALEAALRTTQGSGIAAQEKGPWVERMAKRVVRFERQFFFRDQPVALSLPLPPTPQRSVRALNIPVVAIVTANLLALLAAMAVVVPSLFRRYRRGGLRDRLNRSFGDGQLLWFLAALLLLAYSVYEVSGTFYRAYFRHLLTVILVALAATQIVHPRARKLVKWGAVMAAATCVVSGLVAWSLIAPPLKQGYAGIGVSLQRDWPAFNARVETLAQRCGLTADMSRVAVDDAAYAALRHYPQPVGYNYLWIDEILINGALQEKTPAARLARIRELGVPGYVVRCEALEHFKLPAQHRDGELCCYGI